MFYHAHFNKRCIMPEVAAATVSGVASAAGAGLGYLGSRQQMSDQKELMDKSYQQQVALWNMQNAYMSPKNQMQRFAEAGLNPDLIYGKMGDTSGAVPSVNTPQAPHVGGDITQGALAASQIRLQDSMAAKNKSETKSIDTQTDFYLKTFDTRVNQLTQNLNLTGFQADWVRTMTDYQKQSFSLLNAQTEYWKNLSYKEAYEALQAEKDYENYDKRFNFFMSEVKSRIRLNNSSAQNIERKTRFLIDTWAEQKQRVILENSNLRSKTALNYAMSDMYQVESEYLKQKTLYLPFEYIDELTKGGAIFELDDDGNLKFDESGRANVKSWYSWIELGLGLAGEATSIIGDVAGVILPFKFLKSGFSVGGAKSATSSLSNGHMPSAKPTKGFTPSAKSYPPEYVDLMNKYQRAAPGSKEKQKLYNQLMRFKLD